jgi:hypothetical protein
MEILAIAMFLCPDCLLQRFCVVTVPLRTSAQSQDQHACFFLLGMEHLTRGHAEAACMLAHSLRGYGEEVTEAD